MIKTANFVGVRPLMIDGRIAGTWWDDFAGGSARLTVRTFARPDAATRDALDEEGGALLRFLHPEAGAFAVELGAGWVGPGKARPGAESPE